MKENTENSAVLTNEQILLIFKIAISGSIVEARVSIYAHLSFVLNALAKSAAEAKEWIDLTQCLIQEESTKSYLCLEATVLECGLNEGDRLILC